MTNLFSVEGKTAIVTGASRGNGLAIASGLSELGCSVYNLDIIDVPEDTSINNIYCDITNSNNVQNIIENIVSVEGKVDILINNAGVSYSANILNYTDEMWDKTHNVNVKSVFNLVKIVVPYMKKLGGSIINITSLNSELAFPDNPAYVSSKGALKQLSKSLALDLGKYNIRVNNIGPGYMKTKMTEKSWADLKLRTQRSDRTVLKRWGCPEDLIGAAVFLSSNASSYVTGQDIYVDGGWTIKGL